MFIFASSLLLFVVGACLGSFLAVVALRSVKSKNALQGRSHCDSCLKILSWRDNIPVFSYLVLGGKCRYCQANIPLTHLIVEVVAGLLLISWFWSSLSYLIADSWQPSHLFIPLFWLLVALISLVIVTTDVLYYLIPDWSVITLIGLAVMQLAYLWVTQDESLALLELRVAISGLITVFYYFLWWVTHGRGFGFGDVKLVLPLSLLLPWQHALVAVFLSFVLGAVIGVLLLFSGILGRRQPIPFGPFMIISSCLAFFGGDQIFSWYINLIF